MIHYNDPITREAQEARRALKSRRAFEELGWSEDAIAAVAPAITDEPQEAIINLAASGTHTIISGSPGFRIFVYQLDFWSVGSQDIQWLADSRALSGPLNSWPATSGKLLPWTGNPHWRLQPGESLRVTLSAADQFSGFVIFKVVS